MLMGRHNPQLHVSLNETKLNWGDSFSEEGGRGFSFSLLNTGKTVLK